MSAPTNVLDFLDGVAGATNEIFRLVGSPMQQEAREARAAVAELIEADKRTVRAFEALGEATGVIANLEARRECEAALVALKAVLARVSGERP